MKKLLLCLAVLSSFSSFAAFADDPAPLGPPTPSANDIFNFHVVSDGIFRGGRPTEAGIDWLATQHVKVDLDLENDSDTITAEQGFAAQAGIQFISNPMGTLSAPSDEQMQEILQTITNPENQPIFVHCHDGQNRTGLSIALLRVFDQGWTPQAAYNEMMSYGFSIGGHWALLPYFERRTGFSP
jgi:tyrosine-protein phosphatase SIW14